MGKKLFFSLKGVDINDDEALKAFVHGAWLQATREFSEQGANSPNVREDPSTRERNNE